MWTFIAYIVIAFLCTVLLVAALMLASRMSAELGENQNDGGTDER